MQSFMARLLPFIFLGIMLVLVVVGFILFSYLLIFGAMVGLVLFVIAWIKGLLTSKKQKYPVVKRHPSSKKIDRL